MPDMTMKALTDEFERKPPLGLRWCHRTYSLDFNDLCKYKLVVRVRSGYYKITDIGSEDVNRFKSDGQKKNPSDSNNVDWFTANWYNKHPDEGAGRK